MAKKFTTSYILFNFQKKYIQSICLIVREIRYAFLIASVVCSVALDV